MDGFVLIDKVLPKKSYPAEGLKIFLSRDGPIRSTVGVIDPGAHMHWNGSLSKLGPRRYFTWVCNASLMLLFQLSMKLVVGIVVSIHELINEYLFHKRVKVRVVKRVHDFKGMIASSFFFFK